MPLSVFARQLIGAICLATAVGFIACSNGDAQSRTPGGSDAPRSATSPASPVAEVTPLATSAPSDCPVPGDACDLAAEYLSLIRGGAGQDIGEQVSTQEIECPPGEAPGFRGVLAACQDLGPGTVVDVREFHNGKASLYYSDQDEFAEVVRDLLSFYANSDIAAVGCGVAIPGGTPDCDDTLVAVYGPRDDIFVALVFAREADTWRITKVWAPFPSVIPNPLPPTFRAEVDDSFEGVSEFEFSSMAEAIP